MNSRRQQEQRTWEATMTRMKAMRMGAALAALLLATRAIASGPMTPGAMAGEMNPIPSDAVTTDAGRLSGTLLDGGLKGYFGVPFAAPPVRENRWRAPQ